jgi:hypothetical protein
LAIAGSWLERAVALHKTYARGQEIEKIVLLTAPITALAMNYVRDGSYSPEQ